jgi:LAS superfamily LD-carboxypeptidase LdcB
VSYDKDTWRASVSNGRIPRVLLAEIVPTQYDPDLAGPAIMHPEAAAAMSALLAAAKDAGHVVHVKYSYRTYAKQLEKYADFQAGGNLAAVPGTSNHGWATADDLTWTTPAAIAWVHANCQRFGFRFDVPSENWHIVYYGGFKAPDEPDEEDVMFQKWHDGWDAYEANFKQDKKDGPPPEGWSDWKKKGWNDCRFAINNSKA